MIIKNLNTLPVGTQFSVYNGQWSGEVIMKNGVKFLRVEETGRLHPIEVGDMPDGDYLVVDITHEGTDKPEIYPDVIIGKKLDGSPYYARDLAKELYEGTGWRQWAEMEPTAQAWTRLLHGGSLPHE